MFRSFFSISALVLLSGCAAVVEGQTQMITVKTPGAPYAECRLDNGTVIYRVQSGQTVEVTRNDKDMKVSCLASGNREKEVLVKWAFSDWSAGNVATGIVPGVVYDHFSKAMYVYPDVITVNFTGMPPVSHNQPGYQSADAPKPSYQKIEGYQPTVPQVESDKYEVSPVLRKRDPSTTYGATPFGRSYQSGPVPLN